MCEVMSKTVCHASLLKQDDPRLKRLSLSNRTCIACDMYSVEDIFHVIMQCPAYQEDRKILLDEITRKCPNDKETFEKEPGNSIYYLLVRKIPLWNEN